MEAPNFESIFECISDGVNKVLVLVPYPVQVATGSFGYGYSPLNLLDCISFLVEACAKVKELFNLFQGGSIVMVECVPRSVTDGGS